jgi:AraC-like DNA-binding protein
MSREGCPT